MSYGTRIGQVQSLNYFVIGSSGDSDITVIEVCQGTSSGSGESSEWQDEQEENLNGMYNLGRGEKY